MNEIKKTEKGDNAAQLMQLIMNPDNSQERLDFLFARQREMVAYQAQITAVEAKAAMAVEMPIIGKRGAIEYESRGGKMRSTPYERWEDVVEILTPILSKHGFVLDHKAWTEEPEAPHGKVRVTSYLRHTGGHVEETTFTAPLDTSGQKNLIQQAKSTVSYLKRINAGLLLNFAARGEDNDGADAPREARSATLDDEQIKQIEAAIAVVALPRNLFLGKYKIAEVSELPANLFERALGDIKAYGRRKKGQQ